MTLAGTGLHIHIADTLILDQQDILLKHGDRVGLVGRNGVGKSTLLRVLAGRETFFTGEISQRRGLRTSYLPQEVELAATHTIREVVLDGARVWLDMLHTFEQLPHDSRQAAQLEAQLHVVDAWNLQTRLAQLTTSLGTPPLDRTVGSLSGGEKRRVALCRALISKPELLLLDEPTNHLDTETIEWVESYLCRFSGTVLFVTHDRAFLDNVSTRILEMGWGRLHSYDGNYADFLHRKAEREAGEEVQEKRRLSFIRREAEWIHRGPKARGTKSYSRIRRFEDAVSRDSLQREQDVELVIPTAPRLGNVVVTLDNVTVELGGRVLLQDFSYDFEPGSRLGIVGCNGLGKTTLLKVILGDLKPQSGTVRVGECTQFNCADQHRTLLGGGRTVFEEVGEGREFVSLGAQRIGLWAYLKRFLFTDDEINTHVDQLSGGERSRVVLAKILQRGGNFLILDEPTNDLDLSTLRVLEDGLVDFGGCVVVVSHDRYFLDRVCTGILAFEGNHVVRYQPGNYSYYAAKRQERLRDAAPATTERGDATSSSRSPAAKPRKLTYREQQELDAIEENILAAEASVAQLEGHFSAPDFFRKHGQNAAQMTAELAQQREAVARLYARWEELEAIRDASTV